MGKKSVLGIMAELSARRRWLSLLLAVIAVAWLSACQGRDNEAGAPQEERVMNNANLAVDTRPGPPPIDQWKPGRTETAVFALG